MSFAENPGVEEIMQIVYDDGGYDDYEDFCSCECPIEKCKWDCFKKLKEEAMEEASKIYFSDRWHPSLSSAERNR